MLFACLLDIKCSHCDGVDPQFHSHSRLCSSILSEYIGGGDQSRKFKWLEIHLIHWGNPNGQENQNDWNFQNIHLQLFVEQHYHNIYKELTMQWGQKPCFPGSNFWSKLNHVIQNASHWFFSTPKRVIWTLCLGYVQRTLSILLQTQLSTRNFPQPAQTYHCKWITVSARGTKCFSEIIFVEIFNLLKF